MQEEQAHETFPVLVPLMFAEYKLDDELLTGLIEPGSVVYFPDVGYKEDIQKVHNKIDRLSSRVDAALTKDAGVAKGWIRRNWVAFLTLTLATASLLVAMIAWLQPQYSAHNRQDLVRTINEQADNKLKEPLRQIAELSNDVSQIKGQLEVLTPLISQLIAQRMKDIAGLSLDDFRRQIPTLATTFQLAKRKRVEIREPVLNEVKAKLGQLVAEKSTSWPHTLQLINYRSLLNAIQDPAYQPTVRVGRPVFAQLQPGAQGAHYPGIGYLTIDGFEQTLDYGIWKTVTFRDCLIKYNGGPVVLDNVRFENCEFQIKTPTPPARKLSEQVLASTSVSLTIGG